MIFISIIAIAVTVAGVCSFLIMTGRKLGGVDSLQGRTPEWMPGGCNFCLGWWFSILFSTLAFTLWLPFDPPMILVPILSTVFNNSFTR